MQHRVNSLGQPIGDPVPNWKPVAPPPRAPIDGRYCRIEPIDPERHAAQLFEAVSEDQDGRTWTYMGYGPFATLPEYRAWMKATCLGDDPLLPALALVAAVSPRHVDAEIAGLVEPHLPRAEELALIGALHLAAPDRRRVAVRSGEPEQTVRRR